MIVEKRKWQISTRAGVRGPVGERKYLVGNGAENLKNRHAAATPGYPTADIRSQQFIDVRIAARGENTDDKWDLAFREHTVIVVFQSYPSFI